jgi:molecular chaperone HscB
MGAWLGAHTCILWDYISLAKCFFRTEAIYCPSTKVVGHPPHLQNYDTTQNSRTEFPMTYFEVFDLPPKLGIDTAALEQNFYKLSRTFHPDRFASKPPQEQAEATEKSSLLNDAYRALRDPIRRTEYLLELEGVEMEEQSVKATESARASGTEKKQIVPPDLLEEAFELNMALEEMKMAKQMGDDDPQLRKDLEAARTNFTGMLDAAGKELEGLWTRWDAAVDNGEGGAKDAVKDAMVGLLNRRSYLRNLVRDVNAALD